MIDQLATEVLDHFENPAVFPLDPPLRMALALRDLLVYRRNERHEEERKAKEPTNEQ
jgi:hypothetical protein